VCKSSFTPSHPNPFNASTVASYELRAASHVSLRIYDTAGRLVAALVDEWKPAGKHQAIFDPKGAGDSDLPSGIYLARLTAGDFSAVQKTVLMK
jgi:flagellar hook assembly protein FlgD